MHFQLKNTTFSYASPLDPRIIFLFSEANVTMCIGIFHTYTTVIWMHCGIEQIVSHNASILSSFQSYNALICNILIFGIHHIAFGYDFCQFSINIQPDSITKKVSK